MKSSKWLWAIVGVVLLAGIIVWSTRHYYSSVNDNDDSAAPRVTRAAAPDNVVVPESGSASATGATPDFTGPAGPHTSAQFRAFTLVALGNRFSPDTVIARKGDVVSIRIRAADQDYDFVQPDYGFKLAIAKGETKTIEFNATAPGTFTFYCGLCENNNKVEGSIIISAQ